MQFFLDTSNTTDIRTTATAVVPNVTAVNQATSSSASSHEFSNVAHVLFPALGLLFFVLYLLRLCYKALREDTPASNDHYSQIVP